MSPVTLRRAACLVAVAGVFILTQAVANAADKTHEGKVVSVTEGKDGKDGKLVMTDEDGKNEKTHAVLTKAKITLNKKSAKLGDLKKGDLVTVSMDKEDKVTEVAATREKK